MTAMGLPGVALRPVVYRPTFHKFAGEAVGGVQLHVTDADAFRPYRTGVAFLKACRDQAPDRFRWRSRAYEFVDAIPAIDLLAGGPGLRQGIDAGASLDELCERWPRHEGEWREARAAHLLYE
jgi:uncharacterized protein YbbC (DUF1343 family)